MGFSVKEIKEFEKLIEEYIENPRVKKMQEFSQHGNITTFDHCMRVTRFSFWLNRRLRIGADESVLVPAALLHDMFLYDWHIIGRMNPYHATNHAELASRNAGRYCNVSEEVLAVIRSHMWPINITKFPKTREAVIVTIADKYCSLVETLVCRKGMKKREKKR